MSGLIQGKAVPLRDESGQALVIIGFAMVGLMAFLGLVTDIGWGMYQKRLAQNAADAAVKAALREISKAGSTCSNSTLTTAVDGVINTYVQNNAGATGTATFTREFINNASTAVTNPCTDGASGVRVTASVKYDTFFLRVIGIGSANTSAVAAGRVRGFFTKDAPFIACGPSMVLSSDNTIRHNILNPTTPPTINEAKVGLEFDLHSEKLGQNQGDCGAGTQFKGNSDTDQSLFPTQYKWSPGTRAGPTRVRVAGAAPGCDNSGDQNPNASSLGNPPCLLPIPIASSCVDNPGNQTDTCQVVTWAMFSITRVDANTHKGVLLGGAILEGDASDITLPYSGPVVLTLTE